MKVETKVGLLFVAAIALAAGFAYYLGALNPFANTHSIYVAYNFAGGIEVGSPVRVMGIKVGKVQEIAFAPNLKMPNGEEAKLRLKLNISKAAWTTVKEDSQFFINLAGVIGEKFLEVTPGSADSPSLKPGSLVRGIDPPRIDQLISQSYGLAGKILEMVKNNEGSFTDTIKMADKLVTNLNRLLSKADKMSKNKEAHLLIEHLVEISDDVAFFTRNLRDPKSQKTFSILQKLIWRLDGLDEKALKKFLQSEGIRANFF